MRFRGVDLVVVLLTVTSGCGAANLGGRAQLLTAKEHELLTERKADGDFRRWWRLAPAPAVGLVKWDSDRSTAPGPGQARLLQVIRDELGRVNQAERQGGEVRVAVHLRSYEPRGFLRRRWLLYELVGRTPAGTLLWAAVDEIRPSERYRSSLADGDADLLAREIATKFRRALGL